MRTVFDTINVKAETKRRVLGLKGDQTYDSYVSSLLDRVEFVNKADHRVSLRRDK